MKFVWHIVIEKVWVVFVLEMMAPVSDIFPCSLICMFMIISLLWFLQSVLNLICQPHCQLSFKKEKENDSGSSSSLTMSSVTSFVGKDI